MDVSYEVNSEWKEDHVLQGEVSWMGQWAVSEPLKASGGSSVK